MTSTARVGLFRLGGIISIFNYPWLLYSGFGAGVPYKQMIHIMLLLKDSK